MLKKAGYLSSPDGTYCEFVSHPREVEQLLKRGWFFETNKSRIYAAQEGRRIPQ